MANTSGPIFNPGVGDKLIQDIEVAVADEAQRQWLGNLNASIRVNQGHYVSQINVRADPAGHVVNDHTSVYGPWLEGTGSRNRTTRFKGYASAIRATQTTQARAGEVADPIVARFCAEINA